MASSSCSSFVQLVAGGVKLEGKGGKQLPWDLHIRAHTRYTLQSTFAVTIPTTLLAPLQAVNRVWLPTIKKRGTKVPIMTESFWQAVKVASQCPCHSSIWGKRHHGNCDGWLALWLWLTYCLIPYFPDLVQKRGVLDLQKRLTAQSGFCINPDPDFLSLCFVSLWRKQRYIKMSPCMWEVIKNCFKISLP